MTPPKRIQLSRKRGYRKPAGAVVVSRPSRWGNPFRVSLERSHRSAVEAFEQWLTVKGVTAGIPERKQWVLDHLHELRGKDLACWCPLVDEDGKPVPCHANVLLELSNK